MNIIITPLGTKILRNKYERQNKFKSRANQEFRDYVITLYKHNFKGKQESMVILRFPLLDMEGNDILNYQYDLKKVKKKGTKTLYKKLKVKLE